MCHNFGYDSILSPCCLVQPGGRRYNPGGVGNSSVVDVASEMLLLMLKWSCTSVHMTPSPCGPPALEACGPLWFCFPLALVACVSAFLPCSYVLCIFQSPPYTRIYVTDPSFGPRLPHLSIWIPNALTCISQR